MKNFCQSCGMPLDNPEMLGTEKDGSRSSEFCKYCYQAGSFINPKMTLDEMKTLVANFLQKENAPASVVQHSVNMLPGLKRWRQAAQKH